MNLRTEQSLAWSITGNKATWNLTIPANATGHLPLGQEKAPSYKLDGQVFVREPQASGLDKGRNAFEYQLSAGSYSSKFALP